MISDGRVVNNNKDMCVCMHMCVIMINYSSFLSLSITLKPGSLSGRNELIERKKLYIYVYIYLSLVAIS